MYQRMTANLVGARKVYKTLNGKQYLVVPTVMLTEGVFAGSQGPLLYENSELSKNPVIWNHKPVVVNHPTLNGDGISACDPNVLESQGVGMMLNTNYDGRLKTESWLDEDKLKLLAPKVHKALNNNQMVEVSTGLYHDLEPRVGQWNGKDYTGVVRNMQPDHLAILLDDKGACSIADGAGMLRNASHDLSHNDIKDHLHNEHNGSVESYDSPKPYSERAHIHDVFPKHVVYEKGGKHFKHGYKVKDGKAKFDGEPEEVHKQTTYVTSNGEALVTVLTNSDTQQGPVTVIEKPKASDLSTVMQKQQLQKALTDKYATAQEVGVWAGWVQEIEGNCVIWQKDGKLFRLPYTYDNDKITFGSSEPEEVELDKATAVYRAKTQAPYSINWESTMAQLTNQQVQESATKALTLLVNTFKLTPEQAKSAVQNAIHQGAHQLIHDATAHMKDSAAASDGQARDNAPSGRAAAVSGMISGGKFKEEDRSALMGMSEDGFKRIQADAVSGATTVIQPYTYDGIKDRSNVHSGNVSTQNMTAEDQYIANAPPGVREILINALASARAEKEQLAAIISQNKAAGFNKDWLLLQPVEVLRGMARLSPVGQQPLQQPTANYSGQAGVPIFLPPEPVQNADAGQSQGNILPMPQIQWGETA